MLTLDLDKSVRSDGPKHQWLAKVLRGAIRAGTLSAGEAMDTELQLAERFKISRGPVRQALATLEREGLIYRVRGKGTFIADRRERDGHRLVRIDVLIDYAGNLDENAGVIEMLDALNDCAKDFEGAGSVSDGGEADQMEWASGRGGERTYQLVYHFHRFTESMPEGIHQLFSQPSNDGLLVVPFTDACVAYLRQIDATTTPLVTFFDRVDGLVGAAETPVNDDRSQHYHQCFIDHEQAAWRATDLLLRYGHRHIALVLSSQVSPGPATRERLAGYQRALASFGVKQGSQWVVEANRSQTSSYAAMSRLFAPARRKAGEMPSAVLIGGGTLFHPVLSAVEGMGLRIPEDVSIVTIDDVPGAAEHDPPVSAVRQPLRDGARRALEMLVREILHPGGPSERVALRPELILRESCGPAGDAAGIL